VDGNFVCLFGFRNLRCIGLLLFFEIFMYIFCWFEHNFIFVLFIFIFAIVPMFGTGSAFIIINFM